MEVLSHGEQLKKQREEKIYGRHYMCSQILEGLSYSERTRLIATAARLAAHLWEPEQEKQYIGCLSTK